MLALRRVSIEVAMGDKDTVKELGAKVRKTLDFQARVKEALAATAEEEEERKKQEQG